MLRTRYRKYLLSVPILLIVSAGGILLVRSVPESPAEEVDRARKALSEAGRSQSHLYASGLYANAQNLYDSAVGHWKQENEKWILSRNYDIVRELACESEAASVQALNAARMDAEALSSSLKQQLDSLNGVVETHNRLMGRLPVPPDVIARYNAGRLYLAEAKIGIDKRQLIGGMEKLNRARKEILFSTDFIRELMQNYFRELPHWRRWAERTVEESARNRITVIIIDKFAAECMVYRNGKLICTFPAEFGKSWMGDKKNQGDLATPEGMYRVTERKERSGTRYYKALLLDYPNREDRKRFEEGRARGEIPRDAKIGGLIEIHGHGGKGINWTNGCIALENEAMDILFPLAVTGTPVTIVGSLKDAGSYYLSE